MEAACLLEAMRKGWTPSIKEFCTLAYILDEAIRLISVSSMNTIALLPAAIDQSTPEELALSGSWTARGIGTIGAKLDALSAPAGMVIDGARIESLDTAGAWVLQKLLRRLRGEGSLVEMRELRPEFARLLDVVEQQAADSSDTPLFASASLSKLAAKCAVSLASRHHPQQGVIAYHIVVIERRCRMKSNEEVTHGGSGLMNLLDRLRHGLILADERWQLQTEEGNRLSCGAEQQPSGQRQAEHQCIERQMHQSGQNLLPSGRFGPDIRYRSRQVEHQTQRGQEENRQAQHEVPCFHHLARVTASGEDPLEFHAGVHRYDQYQHEPMDRD